MEGQFQLVGVVIVEVRFGRSAAKQPEQGGMHEKIEQG
jgi:hypothetical protein